MSETARLIKASRAGDREALDALYARHQGRLLNFIRAQLHGTAAGRVTAEDVLQETLLESARKIAGFEPRAPSSFYRWLVGIARFKLSEARRAQRAKKRALEEPLNAPVAAEQTSPSRGAMRTERADQLHEAIAALPDRQAEAVRLRYLEGLTVAETSERLDCSDPATKALVSRGLLALSAGLTRPSAGEPPSNC